MTYTAEELYDLVPYAKTLGMEFTGLEPGRVVVELPWSRDLTTTGGGLHGGALMSLCDVAGAVCAGLNGGPGAVPSTAESCTHFMRPVRGRATATARPLKAGRTLVVVEIDLTGESGELAVRTTQTVALLS
jgi:1,4-dihydroxy-2-naphthoyl-CoA hydrolase